MAKRKSQPTAPPTIPENDVGGRMVTPETGVPQVIGQMQLVQWMTGMGSAPTIMQALKCNNEEKSVEEDVNNEARKLNFSVNRVEPTQSEPSLADVVKRKQICATGNEIGILSSNNKGRSEDCSTESS